MTAIKLKYSADVLGHLEELGVKEHNLSYHTMQEISDFFLKLRGATANHLTTFIESHINVLKINEIKILHGEASQLQVTAINLECSQPSPDAMDLGRISFENSSNSKYCKHGGSNQAKQRRHSKTGTNFRFPSDALAILNQWWIDHQQDPYPTPEEKLYLAKSAKLTRAQVTYWFIYKRNKCRGR